MRLHSSHCCVHVVRQLRPHRRACAALLIAAVLATQGVSEAEIKFMFDFTDPAGTGWNNPTTGLTARQTLESTAELLGKMFNATATIGYTVTGTETGDTLASASSKLNNTNTVGFQPTTVQYKIQTGYNKTVSYSDGTIDWNFNDPWSYAKASSGVGSNQYDFVSTAMHELLHSFGFTSEIESNGTGGRSNLVGTADLWSTFDRFLTTSNGVSLINPTTDAFNTNLLSVLTGGAGALRFSGTNALLAYTNGVPIYTPTTWRQGSSGSHTDDLTFTNALALMMNADTLKGPGVRTLSSYETAILTDIGYSLAAPAAMMSFADIDYGNVVIVNGYATNFTGDYLIGSNSPSNGLIITNGGVMTVTGDSIIGNSAIASNNYAAVTGSGSIWSHSGDVYVGATGSFNQLTIANSGLVVNTDGYIGYDSAASNNVVLVTGAGSVWSNSGNLYAGYWGAGNRLTVTNGGTVFVGDELYVGLSGSSNTLTIASGGRVFNGYGYIGFDGSLDGGGNSVLVTGSGSLWSNANDVILGGMNDASGNSLTLANGGQVFNVEGLIGFDNGASNNTVWVTGPGSVWSNSGGLFVGYDGSGNRLTLTNGGAVFSAGGYIGYGADNAANSNSVLVTGPGSIWNNSGDLYVGATGSFNTLTLANGGQVFNDNGYIGCDSNAIHNAVTVTGSGSVWSNSGVLHVGYQGSGNSLILTNGGQVFSVGGCIGDQVGANSNAVVVTGAGSVWSNSNDLIVGNAGSFNTLTIANSGQVYSVNGYIGNGANSNGVVVTGAGSVWNNSGDLYAGNSCVGNTLTIANGGTVFNADGWIGYAWGDNSNGVTVAGAGSLWSNSGSVYVGGSGSGNSLTVTHGGGVASSGGYIGAGFDSAANSNSVLVTGAGSMWNIAGNLYVGDTGSFNQLTLNNGGQVLDIRGYVGLDSNAMNNSVLVTGAGSVWSNNSFLYVGYLGSGNSLTVTNGGRAFNSGGLIGFLPGSTSNSVTVTGTGSVWNSDIGLMVGFFGSANALVITNGGAVFSTYGYIGNFATATNNSVLVTGAGSVWSNTYNMCVGINSSGNLLTIANGGQVFSADAYIGSNPGANNNLVTVTDSGSVWNNNGALYVGGFGSSNCLTLASGGRVVSSNGWIGSWAGSNNTVLVTDAGSVWNNSGILAVGSAGSNNSLTVQSGGRVFSDFGVIGGDGDLGYGDSPSTGSFSLAIVTGAGSLWSNNNSLYVGYFGSSNSLTIADRGTVIATNIVIGFNPDSGNAITVSGGFLYATNGAGTGALDVRTGTLTLNSGAIMADMFYATNGASSVVNLNGGTLSAGAATVSNNTAFLIGDGVSAAALVLRSGVSSFANDLVLRNNATLTMFNTVNVGGNFTQNLGGALVVEFGGTSVGQYGYLNIAGSASLTGMVEAAGFSGFTPTNGLQITFLHAAGGWTNGFSSFTNLMVQTALAASLIYPDANDVAVKWNQSSFALFAVTPNQLAVANALNAEANNPRMTRLINYLDGLPASQLPAAFDSLSPQGLASMSQVGAGMAGTQFGNLFSHFGTLRGGGGNGFNGGFSLFDPSGMMDWVDRQPRLASMLPMEQDLALTRESLTSGVLRRSPDNPWGVFVEGAGQFVGVDASQGVNGYHVTSAGLTVGVDRQLLDATAFPHDQIVVGAALGYANSSSYLANNGRVDVNGAQGTLYGLWYKEGWHVEAAGGGGANVYDTKRQVLGQDATGSPQGYDLEGMLGGGYDWHLEEWIFGPRASVQYTTVNIDGFTESGSLAPLTIGSQNFDSLLSQVGMHVSRPFRVEKTLWIPDLSLGWQHESLDSVTSVNAQFANGSGNLFSSQGVPLGRDSAVVGLGLTVQWSKDLATYINYGTELMRNNYSVQNVSAGIRFAF